MKINRLMMLVLALSVYAPISLADGSIHTDGWFVGGNLGLAWPNLDKSSTSVFNGSMAPFPNNFDRFSIDHSDTDASWSLFTGFQMTRPNNFLPSISVACRYQRLTEFDVDGMIQEFSLPEFTNYNYDVEVSSDIITLIAKLAIYQWGHFAPYLSAGLGEAFNNVSSYHEKAVKGVTPRVSPAFQNHTSTSFMYNIGAGIDYTINNQVTASLGYEFEHLGRVASSRGKGTWQDQLLSFGNMVTSTIL